MRIERRLAALALAALAAAPLAAQAAAGERESSGPAPAARPERGLLPIPRSTINIPAPLTPKDKFEQYLRDTYGPVAHLGTLAGAGWDQARDNPEEWDGARGFGRRSGSRALRFTARSTIRMGLDIAMSVDSHYRRCDCNGFFSRARHAVGSTFVAHRDRGGRMVAVPRIAAAYSAAFFQNAWYPEPRNSPRDALARGSLNLGYDACRNLLKEFWPDVKRKFR